MTCYVIKGDFYFSTAQESDTVGRHVVSWGHFLLDEPIDSRNTCILLLGSISHVNNHLATSDSRAL